ncbi:hypothetical protein MKY41_06470 [Sporosarcina sp. FSL W7-1349]|uniref:Rpn family recombination-promoting nuclease/putative transposase n=1 Tax=Sporosarcina sp. FSL W7-1349 TaxID=2921561 RepID=UPI0030F5C15A
MVSIMIKENPISYEKRPVGQDGLWKKVIGELFEEFLVFFAPELHGQVDFSKGQDFLQQELFQEVVDEKKGRRSADQLIKVHLKSGEAQWILVHVEVQSSNETDFSLRMFQYFYRIFDRYGERITAMAIHTSPHRNNAPEEFSYSYFGTTLHYAYTNRKILEYDWKELRRSDKLFSKIVLAAKVLHETEDEERKRYLFKRRLMREVVRNPNYSHKAVQAVFHFVDFLLRLPKEWEQQLVQDIYPILGKEKELMQLYNKENASPTIASVFEMERLEGKQEGKLEGRIEGRQVGRQEGRMEERRNIAKKLLAENMPIETIAHVTKLSAKEVKDLQKDIQ